MPTITQPGYKHLPRVIVTEVSNTIRGYTASAPDYNIKSSARVLSTPEGRSVRVLSRTRRTVTVTLHKGAEWNGTYDVYLAMQALGLYVAEVMFESESAIKAKGYLRCDDPNEWGWVNEYYGREWVVVPTTQPKS